MTEVRGSASHPPRPAAAGSATCMLLIGDRVVLRAAAPPEAEYALFETSEIELRASEPGRVREHGYLTTAERARARLAALGLSGAVARECAVSMHPVISEAYARGMAVRHVARYLGPIELFQSDTYDAGTHLYRGVFIDLPLLVRDLELEHVSATMQGLYLAALLESEPDDTTVLLSTEAWTKTGKPGARTHKRPALGNPRALGPALAELARLEPKPEVVEQLPRADVIAFLRTRADSGGDAQTRGLYQSLERAVALRDMPDRGPLAYPDLWAIEGRLDTDQLDNIVDAIDQAERIHGRTPGTTYLRARAALAMRLEPPKLIAERVAALALSMTSFQELSLLAAEAWLEAGDHRRAMPYARDLVDAPGIDEGLLLRAQRLLARAVGAAPDTKHKTIADGMPAPQPSRPSAPPRASAPPPVSVPDPNIPSQPLHPAPSRVRTIQGGVDSVPLQPPSTWATASASSPPPIRREEPDETPPAAPVRALSSKPPVPREEPERKSSIPPPARQKPAAAEVLPGLGPPPLDLELTPPPRELSASFSLDLPAPEEIVKPPPVKSEPPEAARTRRRRHGGVMEESVLPPPKNDPRAEPDSIPRAPIAPREARGSKPPPLPARSERPTPRSERPRVLSNRPIARGSEAPPKAPDGGEARDAHARPTPLRPPSNEAVRPPAATPVADANLGHEARAGEEHPSGSHLAAGGRSFMHGSSLPPYRHENPAPLLTKAPLLPRLGTSDELAEHLALPPGIGIDAGPLDVLPKSVLEARIQFTLLSRELGLDYRLKRGIDLRADVTGIEAMQAVLVESFPNNIAKTPEEAYELRRHGAFLSEILARRLGAEWLDITPNELGYWAMIVPPDTRVWPFGRVARLIAMRNKERDLVSYFLELQSRARGR